MSSATSLQHDVSDRPVRSVGLATQVEQVLMRRIRSGEFATGDQLPSEHDLSTSLGVSRATLRAALNALVRRGLIVSKQGVGNFVSEASTITNNLADAVDFNQLISQAGGTPVVVFDSAQVGVADESAAHALRLENGDFTHWSAKRFTSEGHTMVYALTSIPMRLLTDEVAAVVIADPMSTEPLFDFCEEVLGLRTEFQVTSVRACLGRDCPYPNMDIDQLTPLLEFEETGYTNDNVPIWHSVNWYPAGGMQFQLVRQRPPGRRQDHSPSVTYG